MTTHRVPIVLDTRGREISAINETNGAFDVYIQDQTTEEVTFFFREVLNVIFLASTVTLDAYNLTLVTGHNVEVGDTLVFKEDVNFFQAIVLTVDINDIGIDRPFDFAYTTDAIGQRCNVNMAVDGSVTPHVFKVTPAGLNDIQVDVTKIHFHIQDNAVMTGITFGGMTALTKGVVVRSINGRHKVHFNIKKNGDFALHCDDVTFNDRAAGSNVWCVSAIKRYAGNENQGVVIRLDSESLDEMQIIIQDTLNPLMNFIAVLHGHVVSK